MIFAECNKSLLTHAAKHNSLILFVGGCHKSRKFENVEQLKQAIVLEWCALSQRFIDDSIDQWRRWLQRVVQENDGHIEHKFKQPGRLYFSTVV